MKDTFDFCKDMNKVFKNYDVEFVSDKDDVEDSVTVLVDAKNPKIVAEYIYNNHFKGVKDTNVGVDGNKVMLVFYNFSEYSTDEIERLVSDAIFDANARYNLFESKSFKESRNIFGTLEDAWDKSTLNNNMFKKTVLKLATDNFKDPFDKYSTIYMFADGSSIDCDDLNPFDCEWCTYVSEDLSFVYEFKK